VLLVGLPRATGTQAAIGTHGDLWSTISFRSRVQTTTSTSQRPRPLAPLLVIVPGQPASCRRRRSKSRCFVQRPSTSETWFLARCLPFSDPWVCMIGDKAISHSARRSYDRPHPWITREPTARNPVRPIQDFYTSDQHTYRQPAIGTAPSSAMLVPIIEMVVVRL